MSAKTEEIDVTGETIKLLMTEVDSLDRDFAFIALRKNPGITYKEALKMVRDGTLFDEDHKYSDYIKRKLKKYDVKTRKDISKFIRTIPEDYKENRYAIVDDIFNCIDKGGGIEIEEKDGKVILNINRKKDVV